MSRQYIGWQGIPEASKGRPEAGAAASSTKLMKLKYNIFSKDED